MKKHKIDGFLPVFTGFYNTIFDLFENLDEEEQEKLNEFETEIDWESFNRDASIELADNVEEILSDIGIDLLIDNPVMSSPKYYNYSNDSVDCEYIISDDELNKIINYLKNNIDSFSQYIKNNYTSCDGFISGYSNKAKDWLVKDTILKDDHMFSSILQFIINDKMGREEAQYELYEKFSFSICPYNYLVNVNSDDDSE